MVNDTLRKYLWLWVIIGVLLLSAVIILIFLLINRYITRGGMSREERQLFQQTLVSPLFSA